MAAAVHARSDRPAIIIWQLGGAASEHIAYIILY